jgi:hypothetical protein
LLMADGVQLPQQRHNDLQEFLSSNLVPKKTPRVQCATHCLR